jgi:signal transduction histidine kinase
MLDDYGLLAALQWYTLQFSKRTGIQIRVHGTEPSTRKPGQIEITLFRIAQEALTNVAKHAHATSVDIHLDWSDDRCMMTIADNGRGFEASGSRDTRARPGLGMVTMRERAEAVGGEFWIESVADGTQIRVTIPCNHENDSSDR